MTLLVAWTGIDSRGPASVYIATDSRLSWGKQSFFDHAIKTYALHNFPAIIGFCGDVLVSQMIISQTIALVKEMEINKMTTLDYISNVIVRILNRSYADYPIQRSTGNFTIIVSGRRTLNSVGDFECYKITSKFDSTIKDAIQFPEASGPIVVTGSGTDKFKQFYEQHQQTENPNRSTSRDVFHAFYQTITSGSELTVGVIPQIVSVIRKPESSGFHCGVVANGKRYMSGQLIDYDIIPANLKWFNENFEITDPSTKKRAIGAQPQPPFRC